jgi:hypothetical protein
MLIFKAPAPGLEVQVQVGYEDVKIIREVPARAHFQSRIIISKAGPCVAKNKGLPIRLSLTSTQGVFAGNTNSAGPD